MFVKYKKKLNKQVWQKVLADQSFMYVHIYFAFLAVTAVILLVFILLQHCNNSIFFIWPLEVFLIFGCKRTLAATTNKENNMLRACVLHAQNYLHYI
ncbi:hypothetical protein GDO86_002926 [Hymenochirus boettgeri]|uniref:Uncharacterized protein n=1 Tax=Hymenochirus boettgeri TaxID=247094 RepID=A0A8T2K304_9PIPI|nr:hypothetical protein GDO86_002926 [Hymenochirus boettgeri]